MGPLSSSVIQSFLSDCENLIHEIYWTDHSEFFFFLPLCSSIHSQRLLHGYKECVGVFVYERGGVLRVGLRGRAPFIFIMQKSFSDIFWPHKPILKIALSLSCVCMQSIPPPPSSLHLCCYGNKPLSVAPCWILPSMLAYADITWVNHSAMWSYEQVWMLNAELDPPDSPPIFRSLPHLIMMRG